MSNEVNSLDTHTLGNAMCLLMFNHLQMHPTGTYKLKWLHSHALTSVQG